MTTEEMEKTPVHTMHRIFVSWEKGGYLSTVDPDFHKVFQHMVSLFGPPDIVEYRADDEGWESNNRDLLG